MIEERLQAVLRGASRGTDPLFVRTKLKEVLQDEVLEFVYNDQGYRKLLFTGGTCLRRLYGLPRLSEDLDFDVPFAFDPAEFARDVQAHVTGTLQFSRMTTKISGSEQSVFLVFPILKQLGLVSSSSDSPNLFLRCDLAREETGLYGVQVSPLSTGHSLFFVQAYDLPTLFGDKLAAFLGREYLRGDAQTLPFKGRDVFDLVWFLQRSQQTGWSLQPNWKRVLARLHMDHPRDVILRAAEKAAAIDPTEIVTDLRPFIESTQALDAFQANLHDVLPAQLRAMAEMQQS
jgi:predicted nucleotidyltransferase component of viral defense system